MRIVNISATINFQKTIDMQSLLNKLKNVKYNPKKFTGLIHRSHKNRFTATFFHTGYVVITGVASLNQLDVAALEIAKILTEKSLGNLKIQNIVGTGDIGSRLDIRSFYDFIKKKENIIPSLEPEIYPGLIIKNKNTKCSVTVYTSGKYIITGCPTVEDINTKNNDFLNLVILFRN